MKILVTYSSKTDFTKRYAEIIEKEVDCYLADFEEITVEKMSEFDVVVYGGGIYAGVINGFKKAKDLFDKSSAEKLIVFATGGTPNEVAKKTDVIWKKNLKEEELLSIPHFYMQSGICYEKMSFTNRTLMKMMSNVLSKKKNKDSLEEGFEQAIRSSYDILSKEYAEPLINLLLEGEVEQDEKEWCDE